MADILQKIIADKFQELDECKAMVPLEILQEQVSNLPKCRNFYKAVTKPNPRGLNVIAEVKKASPSAGIIRENFNPVEIALTYQACGADAISVLTDQKYFQGKLQYLTQIKEATELPVLRKDFIIDAYQVYEARVAGADAILLIAEALKPGELMDLMILARQLTMTALVEVHGLDTLLKVRSMVGFPQKQYSVLGINNRDLTTMQVDINTASRLAEMMDDKKQIIAESGIKTRADVEKLISVGFGGVLIGQTLCENDDIAEKFKELFGA